MAGPVTTSSRTGAVRMDAGPQPGREEPSLDTLRMPSPEAAARLSAAEAAELRLPASLGNLTAEPQSVLLRHPPPTLPGARSVTHPVSPENPELRVIHIRQTHDASFEALHERMLNTAQQMSREEIESEPATRMILGDAYRPEGWPSGELVRSTPEFERNVGIFQGVLMEYTDESQANIGQTLRHLKERHGVSSVYNEGLAVENYDTIRGAMGRARATHSQLEQQQAAVEASRQTLQTVDSAGGPAFVHYEREAERLTQAQEGIRLTWQRSAVYELHRTGELSEVLPSETANGNQAAMSAMRSATDRTEPQEFRENIALRIISHAEERGDRVAVLVYGANHSFKDNIEAWNHKHPDRQMALTEVTPRVMLDLDEINRKTAERIRQAGGE